MQCHLVVCCFNLLQRPVRVCTCVCMHVCVCVPVRLTLSLSGPVSLPSPGVCGVRVCERAFPSGIPPGATVVWTEGLPVTGLGVCAISLSARFPAPLPTQARSVCSVCRPCVLHSMQYYILCTILPVLTALLAWALFVCVDLVPA